MSDTPTPTPTPSPSNPPDPGIPTARSAEQGSPASTDPGPRPIFEVQEDRCPRCGEKMAVTDVVCLKCGYDMRANVVREVQTGVVETPAPAAATANAADEFVTPGRLSPKVLGIIGAALTLGAMVAAGAFAPRGAGTWVVIGLVVLTLYRIALHTATGVAAVAIAAKLEGQKFGRGDFALARMFACFALFQLCTLIRLPIWWGLSLAIMWGLGAALYFVAIMLLFKKNRATAMLVALTHFGLWLLLNAGMELSGLISAGAAAAPTNP